ncbi:MAG: YbaB/EbfC family nucleoid-associated protein [Candidatus Aminicenantia bacterium]
MKSLFNLKEMMKKAQEMQEQMRKELAETRVEGTSGGGMVTVVLDGTKNLISIKIDPEVVKSGDIDMLQDLIIAAFNDAGVKVDQVMSEKLGSLGAGLKIPGLF